MKSEFQINYVGGPEVVPRQSQMEAIRTGVLDMGFIAAADLQDSIPEVIALVLSKIDPSAERKSGFFDYFDKAFQERGNAKLIGRLHHSPFYLWVNKKPEKLADLKGLKMRTAALYDRFMQQLGMVPVTINMPDVFTSLEGGVVDGFGWGNVGPRPQGWIKKAKYAIDLPFFDASNLMAVMNLDKWKSLSPAVQKKIIDHLAAFEPKMVEYFKAEHDKEWTELVNAGVVRVKFSDAENKQYLDAAYSVEWAALEKQIGREKTEQLRKMSGN